MTTHRLEPYINLLSSFLKADISASDFESQYLNLYKSDTTLFPDDEFLILDQLFGDVDAFSADPNLRDSGDLDETELRRRVMSALDKLKGFVSS